MVRNMDMDCGSSSNGEVYVPQRFILPLSRKMEEELCSTEFRNLVLSRDAIKKMATRLENKVSTIILIAGNKDPDSLTYFT